MLWWKKQERRRVVAREVRVRRDVVWEVRVRACCGNESKIGSVLCCGKRARVRACCDEGK